MGIGSMGKKALGVLGVVNEARRLSEARGILGARVPSTLSHFSGHSRFFRDHQDQHQR